MVGEGSSAAAYILRFGFQGLAASRSRTPKAKAAYGRPKVGCFPGDELLAGHRFGRAAGAVTRPRRGTLARRRFRPPPVPFFPLPTTGEAKEQSASESSPNGVCFGVPNVALSTSKPNHGGIYGNRNPKTCSNVS